MPMDRSLYPANWEAIARRVRERAGDRCEWCGKENHRYIATAAGGYWSYLEDGEWFDAQGHEMPYRWEPDEEDENAKRIVLTVAHLNHDPQDNSDANLRCLCQWCHLRHDGPHHRQRAAETRMRRRAAGMLPGLEVG